MSRFVLEVAALHIRVHRPHHGEGDHREGSLLDSEGSWW
jgi:hypothetical protein